MFCRTDLPCGGPTLHIINHKLSVTLLSSPLLFVVVVVVAVVAVVVVVVAALFLQLLLQGM